MIKYVEKYPHPGTRPPDPGPQPNLGGADPKDLQWDANDAWSRIILADQEWGTKMRRHLNAKALDACLCAPIPDHTFTGHYDGAHAAQYLAALGEPWPREVFP